MNNKFILALFFFVSMIAISSCNKVDKDDFNSLKDQVNKNTGDISDLKTLTSTLQSAVDNGQMITNVRTVTKVEGGQTISGIEITFSGNGGVKTIWNGANSPIPPAAGLTPYVWINSSGMWAMNFGSIPNDKDNASFELKNQAGESIPARDKASVKAWSVEVIEQQGKVAFRLQDNNASPAVVQVKTTDVVFETDTKLMQAVVEYDDYVGIMVNNATYRIMREVCYPTSITMLANSMYVEKGKSTVFNVKVNPSNARFTLDMLSLRYVPTLTRAAASVIIDPDFVKISGVEAVTAGGKPTGEYSIKVDWLQDIPNDDRALFVSAKTSNQRQELIEVISSTPIYLSEKFVPINQSFIENFASIIMFQGETYGDTLKLTTDAEGKYIWDKGYISTTALALAPTANITASVSNLFPNYHFSVEADLVPSINTVQNYAAKYTISDNGTPNNSIDKDFPIYVYPWKDVLCELYRDTTWIPVAPATTYFDVSIADTLNNAGLFTSAWDFASTTASVKRNGVIIAPESEGIAIDLAKIASDNKVFITVANMVNEGVYEVEYTIDATAKVGTRHPSLPQEKSFRVKAIFVIKAPVFHMPLSSAVATDSYVVASSTTTGEGMVFTYTLYKYTDITASAVFDIESCTNLSDEYKAQYNIKYNSPSYTYAAGAGKQGLTLEGFPVVKRTDASVTNVVMYSHLITGQKIPVYISDFVTKSGDTYVSSRVAGKANVKFGKYGLEEVKADDKSTGAHGRYNFSALQTAGFNLNNDFDIYGYNNTQPIKLHSTTIASVVYSVEDNMSDIVNLPKKLLAIDQSGNVTAVTNTTWDTSKTVAQPIRITMTDIWGTTKTKVVYIYLNSQSVPSNP